MSYLYSPTGAAVVASQDKKPVERAIEARSSDDAMSSMVRTLSFAKTYLISCKIHLKFHCTCLLSSLMLRVLQNVTINFSASHNSDTLGGNQRWDGLCFLY